jgi:hypothetical protein
LATRRRVMNQQVAVVDAQSERGVARCGGANTRGPREYGPLTMGSVLGDGGQTEVAK